jgi:hypothetical protein
MIDDCKSASQAEEGLVALVDLVELVHEEDSTVFAGFVEVAGGGLLEELLPVVQTHQR